MAESRESNALLVSALQEAETGLQGQAFEQVFPIVYEDLRRLARRQL